MFNVFKAFNVGLTPGRKFCQGSIGTFEHVEHVEHLGKTLNTFEHPLNKNG